MSFLEWLQDSPVGDWVRSSDYGYYVMLSGHAIGMGVVTGIVLMLGLRTLGFAKDQPLLIFERLFTIAWWGFTLNFITGMALFSANGPNLVKNIPFISKLSFIAVGGVMVWLLWRQLMEERLVVIDANGPASTKAKALAVATLVCWVVAIMFGRIIGYTIDY